jgi:hypothetical protein
VAVLHAQSRLDHDAGPPERHPLALFLDDLQWLDAVCAFSRRALFQEGVYLEHDEVEAERE